MTLPPALRKLVRRHQNDLDDIVLRAAAHALITLAAAPHDVGGLRGGLWVLHTWSRPLASQPPGPGRVPAGGLAAAHTEWRPARPTSLIPVQARAKLSRSLVRPLVQPDRPDRTIPEAVWTRGGVVYGNPTMQGAEPVLHYLGRYSHRLALTNSRLRARADGPVCFRDQEAQDQRWTTRTLPAQECSRRFLPHVLPQGFHTVRDYGLGSPGHRPLLHHLQRWLAGHGPAPPPPSPPPEGPSTTSWAPPLRAGPPCPSCAQGLLGVIRAIPRRQRRPP